MRSKHGGFVRAPGIREISRRWRILIEWRAELDVNVDPIFPKVQQRSSVE